MPRWRARDQPEVDGLRVAEAAALGDLHRVHVTDQVGHAGVGGGELLGVPLVAVPPGDRQVVALLDRAALRLVRDRLVGVLPELGAGDHRRPLVEQADQRAQQPGLALAALAEEHDVVAGEQGPLELRDHRGVEPVQTRPRVAPLAQGVEQVVARSRGEASSAGGRTRGAGRRCWGQVRSSSPFSRYSACATGMFRMAVRGLSSTTHGHLTFAGHSRPRTTHPSRRKS